MYDENTPKGREEKAMIHEVIHELSRSHYVCLAPALPICERVQTSGRGDPALHLPSERLESTLRRLTRLWSVNRSFALAVWATYQGEEPADGDAHLLALGLGALPAGDREAAISTWKRWGVGGSARAVRAHGAGILVAAELAFWETDDAPGSAGMFSCLLAEYDMWRMIVPKLQHWYSTRRKAA